MNKVNESLKRQMLIISKLEKAGTAVTADDIISYLGKVSKSSGFSYPEERKSRMRLLQRDINGIYDTFKIKIENQPGIPIVWPIETTGLSTMIVFSQILTY